MRKHLTNAKRSLSLLAMLVVLGSANNVFANATITIINLDGPNEGFNDTTPAAPVGGNPGTTLGQQRLIAFQHAANIWGATLDSNTVIRIQAAFNPLAAGVLGSAGTTFIFRDFPGIAGFPGAEFPATWYGSALADKRAGTELNTNPAANDINAQFNSNFNFYLGLDNNHGASPDLVVVLLHEFGHGLNFQTFVNPSTGANNGGFTDIYARHLMDATLGLHWNEMTQAQRQAAATKFGRVIWDGPNVASFVPDVLVFGSPDVRVNSPGPIAGSVQFGTAAFGPPVGSPNVIGAAVEAAVDVVEPAPPTPPGSPPGTTTDGCSPFINAASIAGKIALIERGFCGFAVKARNATDAGAVGVLIYNNLANVNAGPPGMADDGINGVFVTIPTVSLTRADGLAILGQLGTGVTASLLVDPSIRAGADVFGRARLFAPFPVAPGSSISHYDSVATRNLLMEPAINGNLTHNLKSPDDLTLELMRDVGWFPDGNLDGTPDAAPFAATGTLLVNEGCAPANGQIDPGERVTVNLSVTNNSGASTTNLVARLLSTEGVTAPSGPQNYGVIAAGGAKSLDFSFTASAALTAGQPITVSLQLQDGVTNFGPTSFTFTAGSAPCGGVRLVVKSSLVRVDPTTVQAAITVENIGTLPANTSVLSSAKLGSTNGTPLPQSLGSIAPGGSATATVQFSNSTPGASSTLSAGGTYSGGTFSATKRVTVP
jgi:hypothetical protein